MRCLLAPVTQSSCSVSCGTGAQYRFVSCQSSTGVSMADWYCSSSFKPSTSQACYTSACLSYSWQVSSWGSCSSSCGTGAQSRSVYCQASDGSVASDAFCASAGVKPTGSQTCSFGACATYSWSSGLWGACSVTCGSGWQYRAVACRASSGLSVSESFCSGTKPLTYQQCSDGNCPSSVTYSWQLGTWSSCPVRCGWGVQSRAVSCRGSDGSIVADGASCATTAPASTQVRTVILISVLTRSRAQTDCFLMTLTLYHHVLM